MIVELNGKVYGMSLKGFKGILKIASSAVPFGIYAICKNQTAIMLNEKYESIEKLEKAVSKYKRNGFEVYYNAKTEKGN